METTARHIVDGVYGPVSGALTDFADTIRFSCGTELVEDAVLCGVDVFTDAIDCVGAGFNCDWHCETWVFETCVFGWPVNCSCEIAKSCNVDVDCFA